MTRRVVGVLAALALTLTACGGGGSGASDDEIVLGMVNDTSGGASSYSPYVTAGIKVAVDEINQAGGVGGKQLRLVSESDGNESTQTPTIARRLIDDGADVLLLNSGSGSAIAAKPVCAQEELLCVAPANLSAEVVQPPGNEFIHILGPTSAGISEVYKAAFEHAGYERLAFVSDDNPTIQSYVDPMAEALTSDTIELVANEKIPPDAADVSAQIARVKGAKPDAVLVLSLGGQTEVLVQNALSKQLPEAQRFSLASIGNQPETWPLADAGALEGLVFIGSIDQANPRTAELTGKLEEHAEADYQQITGYQAQGYDAVHLVRQALEAAGGADDPAAVNDAFQKISGYEASYGQEAFTLSYGTDKHVGADGNCGIVLQQFGPENLPAEQAWDVYQPSC